MASMSAAILFSKKKKMQLLLVSVQKEWVWMGNGLCGQVDNVNAMRNKLSFFLPSIWAT